MCRTAVDQQKYEEICSRLVNAKRHIVDTKDWLVTLKATKPKLVYIATVHYYYNKDSAVAEIAA